MPPIFIKIKEFFLKYEQKIVLIIAFCFISAVSFQFGVLQGQKWQQKPLIIEKPTEVPDEASNQIQANSEAQSAIQSTTIKASNVTSQTTGCTYVGSRSSNKFYLPTCSYAKRIKPENVVCFKTAAEALSQGRTESKCK
ncbi:MAG: hypothetical protein HGA61_00220 [Candidatus Moranbacteria bacterium]|nr:hypothetical protein [Candidatus Moranbacteria bacterium]